MGDKFEEVCCRDCLYYRYKWVRNMPRWDSCHHWLSSVHINSRALCSRLHSLSDCYVNYPLHVSPPVILNFPLVPLGFSPYLLPPLPLSGLSYFLPLLHSKLPVIFVVSPGWLADCHHNGIVVWNRQGTRSPTSNHTYMSYVLCPMSYVIFACPEWW